MHFICKWLFENLLNIDIWTVLTAVGTIGAAIVAVGIPFLTKYLDKRELKQRIKINLPMEIYTNFSSITEMGLMEVEMEDMQYTLFNSNLHIFNNDNVYEIHKGLLKLYSLFRMYQSEWTRERPNYTYFIYEIKFGVKVEVYKFLDLLGKDDLGIRELLTKYLLNEVSLQQIEESYIFEDENNILKFLKEREETVLTRRAILRIGNQMSEEEKFARINEDRRITVDLFEEYFDNKYRGKSQQIQQFLDLKLEKLN